MQLFTCLQHGQSDTSSQALRLDRACVPVTNDAGLVDRASVAVKVGRVHEYGPLDAQCVAVNVVSYLKREV